MKPLLTRRRAGLLAAAATLLPKKVNAAIGWMLSQTANIQPSWQVVTIGGGGFITGIDIVGTTMVSRCDIFGTFIYNGAGPDTWSRALNSTNSPAAVLASTSATLGGSEIKIAPTNTSRIYNWISDANAGPQTFITRSDDGGQTWVNTNWSTSPAIALNPQDSNRGMWPKMAVDPNNQDAIICGTLNNGCYYSTNKGTSFTAVTGSAAGGGFANLVAFDGHSTVSGGNTQGVYLSNWGNGIYYSSTGVAGTFSQVPTTGMPTHPIGMRVNPKDGKLLVINSNSATNQGSTDTNLYFYTGGAAGTWSSVSMGGNPPLGFDIDPNTSGVSTAISAVDASGKISYSTNYGSSWSNYQALVATSPQIPWLASSLGAGNFLSAFNCAYDSNSLLWLAQGLGVWSCTPNGTGVTWTSHTRGIENMVATHTTVGPGGSPMFHVWDQTSFAKSYADLQNKIYNTYQGFFNNTNGGINVSIDGDWCKSAPQTYVMSASMNSNYAGWSTNSGLQPGGVSSWHFYANFPFGSNGNMLCASTPDKVTTITLTNGGKLYNSQNATSGADTWTTPTISGIATGAGDNGWGGGFFTSSVDRHILRADNTCQYAYNYGGLSTAGMYRSSDGGATWARVFTGNLDANDTLSTQLAVDPNQDGHLLLVAGGGSGSQLYECVNGHTANPQVWKAVTVANGYAHNLSSGYLVSFGKPKPGNSNSTIFFNGAVDGTFSFWRSDDNMATWVNLGRYPAGYTDYAVALSGDPNFYGVCYVGYSGSSFVWRTGP